jgi:hypothetical protein
VGGRKKLQPLFCGEVFSKGTKWGQAHLFYPAREKKHMHIMSILIFAM